MDTGTAAPAGSLTHDATSDTGSSSSDNLTSNTTPYLSGTAEAGASVAVTLNGHTYSTTANGSGAWSVRVSDDLSNGSYTPSITSTDVAGNSATANGTAFTVEYSSPHPPIGHLMHDFANDTGSSQTDNITSNATPGLFGTAEANSAVAVTLDGHTYTTTADGSGAWSVIVSNALADGWYRPSITSTDAAGNSTTANGETFMVDHTDPVAPTVDAQVTNTPTPTLTGSAILNPGDPYPGEHLTVTVDGVTYTLGDGHLIISGTTWILKIPRVLADGTYSVIARLTDVAGNISEDVTQAELVVRTAVPAQTNPAPDAAVPAQTNPAPDAAVPVQTSPAQATQDAPPKQVETTHTVDLGGVQKPAAHQDIIPPTSQTEVRTTNGFHVLVEDIGTPSASPVLRLANDIPDQQPSRDTNVIRFVVPMDTFVHTDPTATVSLSAVMVNGTSLPGWLHFNPSKGEFTGKPPKDLRGELQIKITARDESGRQAETIVRIRVGEKVDKLSFLGRPGLSAQLKAQGSFAWKAERDRLIHHARAAEHVAARSAKAT